MKRKILIAVSILLSVLMLCSCSLGSGADNGDKLAFHLKKLPDIGSYKSPDKVSYFSQNGAQSSFTPSNDYGQIIPYINTAAKFTVNGGDFGYNENIYGFATIDGKIITGGIYENITTEKLPDGQTVYIASVLRANKGAEISDEELWGSYSDNNIIASDGSWVIHCSEGYYAISDSGYICTADGDGSGKVYDFSGNLVLDSTQLFGDGLLCDLYYADSGKFVVSVHKGYGFYDYEEVQAFRQYTVCINSEGEILYDLELDGWDIENYVDGRFIIRNTNTNKYTVCDLYGEKLIDEVDRLQYDKAGNAFIGYIERPDKEKDTSVWIKYDINGNELVRFDVPYSEIYLPEILFSDSVTAVVSTQETLWGDDDYRYRLNYWIDFKKEKMIDIDFDYTEMKILYSYTDDADSFIAFKNDGDCDIYAIDGTYLKTLSDIEKTAFNNLATEKGFVYYKTTGGDYKFKSLTGRTDLEIEKPFSRGDTYLTVYKDYIAFFNYNSVDERRYVKIFNVRENRFEEDNDYIDFSDSEAAQGSFYFAEEEDRAYLLNSDLEVIISISFNNYA